MLALPAFTFLLILMAPTKEFIAVRHWCSNNLYTYTIADRVIEGTRFIMTVGPCKMT